MNGGDEIHGADTTTGVPPAAAGIDAGKDGVAALLRPAAVR